MIDQAHTTKNSARAALPCRAFVDDTRPQVMTLYTKFGLSGGGSSRGRGSTTDDSLRQVSYHTQLHGTTAVVVLVLAVTTAVVTRLAALLLPVCHLVAGRMPFSLSLFRAVLAFLPFSSFFGRDDRDRERKERERLLKLWSRFSPLAVSRLWWEPRSAAAAAAVLLVIGQPDAELNKPCVGHGQIFT